MNAAAREHGVSFSKLMGMLKTHKVELNKKMLAELAVRSPKAFEAVVAAVSAK